MTADEPVAGVPRLCARRADCTRPSGHGDECGPDRADTELADLRAEVERLRRNWERGADDNGNCPPFTVPVGALKTIRDAIEAERDDALARLAEVEGVARTNAAWVQQQHAAAKGAREQVKAVWALAVEWAEQPTDYDEDTEQQIADGRAILDALDAVEPADQPRFGKGCATCNYSGAVGTLDDPHPCHECTPADQPTVPVVTDDPDGFFMPISDGETWVDVPADQPHPTPEADECLHTPEHSRTLCGYCGEQESWCLDCGAALHKCEAGS